MDDGSRDKTFARLTELGDERVKIFQTPHNRGAAFSRWKLIRACDPDSVLVFLDLDDWLTDNCLPKLIKPYSNGKLVTMGNYTCDNGSGGGSTSRFYSKSEIDNNTFVKCAQFKCPPLRTFHGSLIPKLTDNDFKVHGRWVQTCTDVALFWKILWSVNWQDVQVISDIMYIYRRRQRGRNAHRYDKKGMMNYLRNKYVVPGKRIVSDRRRRLR